jgi:hypothetical protein
MNLRERFDRLANLYVYAAFGWAVITELAVCAGASRLPVALLLGLVILLLVLFGWTRPETPKSRAGHPEG